MKFIAVGFMALLVLGSCERDLDIDIPSRPSKLVVNGLIEKGQPIELRVSKSRHILAGEQGGFSEYVVNNASVVIYEDGITYDSLVYEPIEYMYRSPGNKFLKEGHTYSLRVETPGFATVNAQTGVPSQSTIAEVSIERDARINSYGQHQDEVIVKFNDPPGESNTYLVEVYSAGYMGFEGNKVWCVSTTDKDLEQIGDNTDPLSSDNCFDGGSLLMKDVNFNGTQKVMKMYVDSYYMEEMVDQINNRTWRPYIKVKRITDEHFKYVKSYHLYYNASDNPFAEPVNVFTNVNGGYGIFAAYTSAVDTLQ